MLVNTAAYIIERTNGANNLNWLKNSKMTVVPLPSPALPET